MAIKTVQVEIKQGAGFKTECRAGQHLVVIDQPVAARGTDAGPTPLEIQLMALGGCIAAIGRIVANQRKLVVRGMEIAVEGEIDTDRLLGKVSDQRTGFSALVVRVKLDADLSPAEQESFLREVDERCPISENLQNATPVKITLGVR